MALSTFFFKAEAWEYLPEINDVECSSCHGLIKGKIDIKNVEVLEEYVCGMIEFKMLPTVYRLLIPNPRIFDMILVFIESTDGKVDKCIGCHNLGLFKINHKGNFLDIQTAYPVFRIPKYVFKRSNKTAIIFKKRTPSL